MRASQTPAALPPDYSLGASRLEEREDICESVVRFLAAKDPTKQNFIGFENIVQGRTVHHDPTDELLRRLRDLGPRVLPVSELKGVRVRDGIVVDYHYSKNAEVCWLWGMEIVSKDQATFDLREGSTSYRLEIVRRRGRWTTVGEKPMAFF